MNKILVFAVVLLTATISLAQKDSTSSENKHSWKFEKERLFFGGGIGGGVGAYTAINFSPVLGYRFTDKIAAGPRIIYNYFGTRFASYSNYGYGFMGRYFPQPKFFLQSEYQQLYVKQSSNSRYRIPVMYIGGGYYQRPLVFYVLYDLLWTTRSPQNSPVQVNFGLMF